MLFGTLGSPHDPGFSLPQQHREPTTAVNAALSPKHHTKGVQWDLSTEVLSQILTLCEQVRFTAFWHSEPKGSGRVFKCQSTKPRSTALLFFCSICNQSNLTGTAQGSVLHGSTEICFSELWNSCEQDVSEQFFGNWHHTSSWLFCFINLTFFLIN